MKTAKNCPQCGTRLPDDAPEELCPRCLVQAGLPSRSTGEATLVAHQPSHPPRALPQPGQQFGGYRIVRELGRGGMGAVYEAEHLESGRRVALKVLSHQLDSPEARARFLREGRLAASINHPNSVYVFGTEEIEGTPAIAMELIAGGTLQERVQAQGALSVGLAVDAILQVIAGLEAAQAVGILHRDVKPANCFLDAEGTVKIGDFGLSISAAARGDTHLTVQGTFLGTPAFCSPEQLRGEELNLRSDMYSVGVTLFYLLTGRTPFDAKNMVQLLSNVLEQPAPSPRTFRPQLAPGLAKAILRCLEKQPGERFRTYDELRQALAPFSSAAPVPAPLALRFGAGVLDTFLLSAIGATVGLTSLQFGLGSFTEMGPQSSSRFLPLVAGAFGVMLLYYALLEGWWGASVGKALCRLRVVGAERHPPGVPRSLARALIYLVLPPLPYWIAFGVNPYPAIARGNSFAYYGASLLYYVLLALLFCTARRRNGWAALHDLLTGTHVIRRPACQNRPGLQTADIAPPVTDALRKVGPYHVLETFAPTTDGDWLLGYDTRLLRKAWIRLVPPGTPPVASALRNLGRVGRLRWITGRRGPDENWDAFEGATGRPLLELLRQRQPWDQVRYWLLDLATEINAALRDGTLPATLTLDRVWITAEGRAKLLDFPAPGLRAPSVDAPPSPTALHAPPPVAVDFKPGPFLLQVAASALGGQPLPLPAATVARVTVPLPLHARAFLETLPASPPLDSLVATLKGLVQQITVVSRWRRAALVGGCVALPLVGGLGFTVMARMMDRWQRAQPDIMALSQVLNVRQGVRMAAWWGKPKSNLDDRLFALYIAGHFPQTITNAASWSTLYAVTIVNGENRQFAEQAVASHPHPADKEVAEAAAALRPHLEFNSPFKSMNQPWMPPFVAGICLLAYVALPAVLAALLCRGGLVLWVAGVVVVRKDGVRASRLRALWRSLVTWSPLFAAPFLTALLTPWLGGVPAGFLSGTLVVALAAWSLALPQRSLQDRLAGTHLVPR